MKSIVSKLNVPVILALAAVVAVPALLADSASAQPAMQFAIDTSNQVQKGINSAGGTGQPSLPNVIQTIVNILLFIIGLAAVIMIVIGGLRYVLSGGDSNATKGAKDTVLYAVIGLVVAIMAYAIVNFVVGRL